MFRFCRFLARTGTLLGDGDGGRFCAAENGDDGFSGSWLDIFRKRGGNGVFTGIAEGRRKGDPSVAATGDSTEACHSPVVSKLTVCFSPLSAAIVADNASWGSEWPVLRRCCCRCNFPHVNPRRVTIVNSFFIR